MSPPIFINSFWSGGPATKVTTVPVAIIISSINLNDPAFVAVDSADWATAISNSSDSDIRVGFRKPDGDIEGDITFSIDFANANSNNTITIVPVINKEI